MRFTEDPENVPGFAVYPISITCGVNQHTTECQFSQLQEFRAFVNKTYPSLELPEFPSRLIFSKETIQVANSRAAQLQKYLNAAFQSAAVRSNMEALQILRLEHTIHAIPRARIQQDSFEKPLLSLTEPERLLISQFYIAITKNWPLELNPILINLLRNLKLPESYVTQQMLHRDMIPIPSEPMKQLEDSFKWDLIWGMLSEAMQFGSVDARFHVSLELAAYHMGLSIKELLTIEGTCAKFLQKKLTEMKQREGDGRNGKRNGKILLGSVIGGSILFVTGIIVTPLLLPVVLTGTALVASVLPATLGLSSAVVMGSGLMAMAMAPSLPLVFGAAGAGLGGLKVHKLTEGITEFSFCSIPHVLTESELVSVKLGDEAMEVPYSVNWEEKEVVPKDPSIFPCELDLNLQTEVPSPNDPSVEEISILDADPSELFVEPAVEDKEPIVESEVEEPNVETELQISPEVIPKSVEIMESEEKNEVAEPELFVSDCADIPSSGIDLEKDNKTEVDELTEDFEVVDDHPLGEFPEAVFEEKQSSENTGMKVYICIQGWLWDKSELTTMWMPVREADPSGEIYSLRWETKQLQDLGRCLVKTVTSAVALNAAKFWLAAMSTLAAAFLAAIALPLVVIGVAGAIDNSWSIVNSKAQKVGRILAETLVDRVQGNRPVTLLAVSLGAQVVFHCLLHLRELGKKGKNVNGILENVVILGGACSSNPKAWSAVKPLVAGRIINGFCKSDWVLGLVHRTAGMTFKAAGLDCIDAPCVENFDLTQEIGGHLSYRKNLPRILEIIEIERSIDATDWINRDAKQSE